MFDEKTALSAGLTADLTWPALSNEIIGRPETLETTMDTEQRFSDRHGYAPQDAEIIVRQNAPFDLRGIVLNIARDAGLSPSPLREIVCGVLRKRPDPANWSEYPNIWLEVQDLVDDCEWFYVYDIIEEIFNALKERDEETSWQEEDRSEADKFAHEINDYFRFAGIGWQLKNGRIEVRGAESFELAVGRAKDVLESSDQETANREIKEAFQDLSRRPDPDLTGAVQHAMAALECIARDACGDRKATLGEILKRYPGLMPPPLDSSIEKAWGYASNRGRHLREGDEPAVEEVELVVGIAAVVASYLVNKINTQNAL